MGHENRRFFPAHVDLLAQFEKDSENILTERVKWQIVDGNEIQKVWAIAIQVAIQDYSIFNYVDLSFPTSTAKLNKIFPFPWNTNILNLKMSTLFMISRNSIYLVT